MCINKARYAMRVEYKKVKNRQYICQSHLFFDNYSSPKIPHQDSLNDRELAFSS